MPQGIIATIGSETKGHIQTPGSNGKRWSFAREELLGTTEWGKSLIGRKVTFAENQKSYPSGSSVTYVRLVEDE